MGYCRTCGTPAEGPSPRRCNWCPAPTIDPDSPIADASEVDCYCLGCGSLVIRPPNGLPPPQCTACVGTPKTLRCEHPKHHGSRAFRVWNLLGHSRSDGYQYAVVSQNWRSPGTRKVTSCLNCAKRYNLQPWHEYEASRQTSLETSGLDVELQAKDPYYYLGGPKALWKPRKGHAGIGAYVIYRSAGDKPVWVKGKLYTAATGQRRIPNTVGQTAPVFTFYEAALKCPYGLYQGVIVVDVEPIPDGGGYKHILQVYRDGVLMALVNTMAAFTTPNGTRYDIEGSIRQ